MRAGDAPRWQSEQMPAIFVLPEQGRELIRFEPEAVGGGRLLADTHVILARQDGMIDLEATRSLIERAQQEGHGVTVHEVDGTHLLELDTPEAAVEVFWRVVEAGDFIYA